MLHKERCCNTEYLGSLHLFCKKILPGGTIYNDVLIELLRRFNLARFVFLLRAKEKIVLPSYKGSTLRGGFGNVFRKITCVNKKKKDCKLCSLKDKCVYVYIFETSPPRGATRLKNLQDIPRPFIIEPPQEEKREYLEGEIFTFNLILIGKAIDYFPYFVLAFEELGRQGMGKYYNKYCLYEIYNFNKERVYSSEDRILREAKNYMDIFKDYSSIKDIKSVSISFLTPTRIKFKGDLVVKPEFHIIIRSLLHRISSLLFFHCGEELNIDFFSLIKKAEKIKIKNSSLKWIDWERYSTRQKTKMKLGGFVGEITYYGEIKDFLPLLVLGQHTHIGKNCTFGLGKYRIGE